MHYFEPFRLIFAHFFRFFCLFLQFSPMESCYIWFTISLLYPSAYVYSCCTGKNQNQGLSGGIRGYETLFWAIFAYFLDILTFSTVFHIEIMLHLVYIFLSILGHMRTVVALGKFKIGVCQGVRKPYFKPILLIFWDFLSFSSVFHIGIMLYLVY